MDKFSDRKIISSWLGNAKPWITAIRKGEIESRQLVTNKAIIDAVLETAPSTVLDLGCGEGWLVRELSALGLNCLGLDAVPELIESSKIEGEGRFKVISYEDLRFDLIKERFDTIVCNFSLLGDKSVLHVFQQVPALLNENGSFIIQTIHPVSGCENGKYEDGWREGSWAGFNDQFSDPAPWYFRTKETWQRLFVDHGLVLKQTLEPLSPKTQTPASIIFIGELVIMAC